VLAGFGGGGPTADGRTRRSFEAQSSKFNTLYASRYSHNHVPKQAPPVDANDKLINTAN